MDSCGLTAETLSQPDSAEPATGWDMGPPATLSCSLHYSEGQQRCPRFGPGRAGSLGSTPPVPDARRPR
ncbi:hypothetical protein GCM10009817_10080 [Terrabacter lapilli]|uniref:Uncharacterized protein n=1 Tax=Terrabacter lapilli TaxID=436231 RepID=A0ABN2RNC4_9MICO